MIRQVFTEARVVTGIVTLLAVGIIIGVTTGVIVIAEPVYWWAMGGH